MRPPRNIARDGPPTRKPADCHPPALSLAEQVLVTVLRQRFQLPQRVLATLFGVVTGTIAKAEARPGRCWSSMATRSYRPEHQSRPWPTSPRTPRPTGST
jgi:hypothetical protein